MKKKASKDYISKTIKKNEKGKSRFFFLLQKEKCKFPILYFCPNKTKPNKKKMHWTNTMANIEKRFSFLTITIEPYFQRKKRLKIKLIINRTIHTSMVTTAAAATDFFSSQQQNIQRREYSWCIHNERIYFQHFFSPTRISSCVKYEMKMKKKNPTFCAAVDDKINNFFRGCLPCV